MWLLISCLFSIALVVVRVGLTDSLMFIFLCWNLFLAFVPYWITNTMIARPDWIERKGKFALVFIVWLLFIPNSFYILTDLFHLKRLQSNPWFDLVLIFSFAWNGLLLGVLSVRQMERIILNCFRIPHQFLFLFPLMWLIALGVFIGRYMRFNSWDMVTNPFALIQDVGFMLVHPFQHATAWAMITCFAIFMSLLYISLKKMNSEF